MKSTETTDFKWLAAILFRTHFFTHSGEPILANFWYVILYIKMYDNQQKNFFLQFVWGSTSYWLD